MRRGVAIATPISSEEIPMFRYPLVASLITLCTLTLLGSAPAQAKRPPQTQTEATFVSWDADAHTITVKVRRTPRGKGPKPPEKLRLKRGKKATFNVKESGSVLTSTIVKSKVGTRMDFEKLVAGTKVYVFWVPDENDKSARFARSVSVVVDPDEWNGTNVEVPAATAD